MKQCEKCREFKFEMFGGGYDDCGCKPFNIIDDEGEEYGVIHAIDSHAAAVRFAEVSNVDGDYYLMNQTAEIHVNGEPFIISAEPDVHYSARIK